MKWSLVSLTALLLGSASVEAYKSNAHKPEIVPYIIEANKQLGKKVLQREYPEGTSVNCHKIHPEIKVKVPSVPPVPPVAPGSTRDAAAFEAEKQYVIKNQAIPTAWTLKNGLFSGSSLTFKAYGGTDLQSWMFKEIDANKMIYSIFSAREKNEFITCSLPRSDGVTLKGEQNAPCQQWSLQKVDNGKYMIRSVMNNGQMCLQADDKELKMSPCQENNTNQQFSIIIKPERTASVAEVDTSEEAKYRIVGNDEKNWNVEFGKAKPGQNMIMYPWYKGLPNEIFNFELQDSSEGFYYIISRLSPTLVVQVDKDSDDEGALIKCEEKIKEQPSQLFAFESVSDGKYLVRNKNSMHCIAKNSSGRLIQKACDPQSPDQLFKFEKIQDPVPQIETGKLFSIKEAGEFAWEIENGMPDDKAIIEMKPLRESEEQAFFIEYAKDSSTNQFIIKSELDTSLVVAQGKSNNVELTVDDVSQASQWKIVLGVGGSYSIQNLNSRLCIEMQNKKLAMAKCRMDDPNQQFYLKVRARSVMPQLNSDEYFLIENSVNKKFLDASDEGKPMTTDAGASEYQRFKLVPGGDKPGKYAITNTEQNLSLVDSTSVSFGKSAPNAQNQLFEVIPSTRNTFMIRGVGTRTCIAVKSDNSLVKETCQRNIAGQHFYFVTAPPPQLPVDPPIVGQAVTIESAADARRITLSGKPSDSGAKLLVDKADENRGQQFIINPSSNGGFTIQYAFDSKKALGSSSNTKERGSALTMQSATGVSAQVFKFFPAGGSFMIRNTATDLCLTADQSNLFQDTCNASNQNQQFTFKLFTPPQPLLDTFLFLGQFNSPSTVWDISGSNKNGPLLLYSKNNGNNQKFMITKASSEGLYRISCKSHANLFLSYKGNDDVALVGEEITFKIDWFPGNLWMFKEAKGDRAITKVGSRDGKLRTFNPDDDYQKFSLQKA